MKKILAILIISVIIFNVGIFFVSATETGVCGKCDGDPNTAVPFCVAGLRCQTGDGKPVVGTQIGRCEYIEGIECYSNADCVAPDSKCPSGVGARICTRPVVICNPLTSENFEDLVDNFITFLFYIAIVVAPVTIIIAGFMFLTAAGKLEQVETAKKIILWSIVGLFIILFAKGLVSVLGSVLGF